MTRRLSLLLAASLLAVPAAAQAGDPPEIVVTGRAEVNLPPDRAIISIAVQSLAPTAAAAGSQNAATVRRVLDALVRSGVPADSIHTAGYAVQPSYEQDDPRPRRNGYLAVAALRVRIGTLGQVGGIIDTALGAGADRIDGVQFTSSAQAEGRRRALAQAVQEARSDAEAMAAAAGGSLGPLLSLSTGGVGTREVAIEALSRVSNVGGTSFNATEIHVAEVVVARWAFQRP